jgi:hypothetical protein
MPIIGEFEPIYCPKCNIRLYYGQEHVCDDHYFMYSNDEQIHERLFYLSSNVQFLVNKVKELENRIKELENKSGDFSDK